MLSFALVVVLALVAPHGARANSTKANVSALFAQMERMHANLGSLQAKIARQDQTIAAQGRRIAALLRNATPAADPSPPNELRWFYDLENCPPGWIETKSLRGYLLVRVNDLQMLRVRSLR